MTVKERIQHHCDVSEWYWRQAENTTTDFMLTGLYVKAGLTTGSCAIALARGNKELMQFAEAACNRIDARVPHGERVRQVMRLVLAESAGAAQTVKQEMVGKLDEMIRAIQGAPKK